MPRLFLVAVVLCAWLAGPPAWATEATPQEVADFWETVFAGAPPYGVPPLAATRSNARAVGSVNVWDVSFDSYRDPDTDQPVRLYGFLALPGGGGPGPAGAFPGLISTHRAKDIQPHLQPPISVGVWRQ